MNFSQLFGSIITFVAGLTIIRAILGFILVFLLPGFVWTLVFFSRVNVLERLALSFGLSIAAVTLSIIIVNVLFGVRITGVTSLLTIIVITIIAVVAYFLKRLVTRRQKAENGD